MYVRMYSGFWLLVSSFKEGIAAVVQVDFFGGSEIYNNGFYSLTISWGGRNYLHL